MKSFHDSRGRRLRALAMATALALGACGLAAQAQPAAPSRSFHIAAGTLEDALNQFTAQSGLQVLYDPALVQGRRAAAYDAVAPASAALAFLLEGSRLTFEFTDANTVVIKRAPAPPPPAPRRTQAEAAPEAQAEVAELGGVTVVGTLLRDVAPTSPVVTIEREDIERGGYTSVQDIMAKVPQNFGGQTAGTNFFTGGNSGVTNQIDLRGLGSGATLTLVDGRRISAAAGDAGRAVDVDMIPVSAIERIDILTDGASALYGSDAVGGVVNIVLRKDFQGLESALQLGHRESGGGEVALSQAFGHAWQGGRLLGSVQYERRDAIAARDFGVGESLDLRARGGGDYRIPALGVPGTVLPLGYFDGEPFATLTGPDGTPVYSAALPRGQDGRALRLDQLGLNALNMGDLALDYLMPRQKNVSAYLNVEQSLGAVTLFADVVAAQRDNTMRVGSNISYLFVPTSNAFTPFHEDVLVGYQFPELGANRYAIRNRGWFAHAGLRGELGGDWTWEALATLSKDESRVRTQVLDRAELDARLASPDPDVAFNPFGDGSGQSPGVTDAIRQRLVIDADTDLDGVSTLFQGSVAELPGGALRLAVGGEYRRESLHSRSAREHASAVDEYPGSPRRVGAAFAEAYVPLVGKDAARPGVRELALSAALRTERYSDFGSTTNPKLGLLWRPAESLELKANWGTSFRAPSLRELNALPAVTQDFSVYDPHAPGGPAMVFADLLQGGNPHLKPEKATTWTLAADVRPAWLEGARFSIDYFHTNYRQRIRGSLDGLDETTLLQYEDSLPPGVVVRGPDGRLESISVTSINSAETRIAGFDLGAAYDWTVGGHYFGAFAAATLFDRYEDRLIRGAPVRALEGTVGNPPQWRGRVGLTWSHAAWAATVAANHTDAERNTDADPRIVRRDVASLTTVDLQVSYSPTGAGTAWLRDLTLRFGVDNLFDRRPPFVDGPAYLGFDARNHPPQSRTVYVRLAKQFGSSAR
jgi:outer membrane receptor protein involved in Fe transport